jgi:transposase InsO family protein
VTANHVVPKSIRIDQGPEFISRDLDLWACIRGVTQDFSRPDKPTDNAYIESFNGKFRAECIDQNWFLSLDDARANVRLIGERAQLATTTRLPGRRGADGVHESSRKA